MTIFFTLSGFLISFPFWNSKLNGSNIDHKRYFLRRFHKIYPPLAFSLIILIPIYIYKHGDYDLYIKTGILWLSGIAWFIPVSGKVNPVLWSLIAEVHFYITIPILFFIYRKTSYKKCLLIISFILFFLPIFTKWIYSSYNIELSLNPYIRVPYSVKFDAFSFGVLMAGLSIRFQFKEWLAKFGAIGLMMIFLIMLVSGLASIFSWANKISNPLILHYSSLVACGLLLFFIAKPEYSNRFGLNSFVLRWMGLISYEWYLLHQATGFFLRDFFGSSGGNLLKYLLITGSAFLISILVSAAMYKYISLPILRKFR